MLLTSLALHVSVCGQYLKNIDNFFCNRIYPNHGDNKTNPSKYLEDKQERINTVMVNIHVLVRKYF